MTEKLQQIIKEELAKLPKENQYAINSLNWVSIVEEIGKINLLTEDEINNLQVETLSVLVGVEDPEFYSTNIEYEVGTSKNEALKIAKDVYQKIFTPINNILLEDIKKSGKIKNSKWDQNVDFIVSGGDYSSFVENNSPVSEPAKLEIKNSSTPSISTIPQKRNNLIMPNKPNKMTDIKSKLVI